MRILLCLGLVSLAWAELPNAPGKPAVLKVCGTCHTAEMVAGRAMNRDQWSAEVADMIAKGAKGTPAEFDQVIAYLAATFPANAGAGATATPGRRPPGMGVGADDKHVVDNTAADRGKTVYVAECVTCHGQKARGANQNAPANQQGPDLVRSITVLHDRYGNTLGPFLKNGHPMQSGAASASMSTARMLDLAHFLHQRVNDVLRSGPYSQVINVLTGDAKAGKAYFNGAGGCKNCHSPTGDLKGVATKYDAAALQQKMVFPKTMSFGRRGVSASKPVILTVTQPSGEKVTGSVVHLDDFNVSLRDASGAYRSWNRTPDLKIEKNDPYAAHVELLDRYTDRDIHDLVAYLETLR